MKNKNAIIALIAIFITIFTLEIIKYSDETKQEYIAISKKILLHEAQFLFQNIVITRKWVAEHNGVYVKANNNLKPNPYLKDNHIYNENGDLLIKINPAWMTRQIAQITNSECEYYYKITSLQPLNPQNRPDRFEKEALKFLNEHKEQKYYTKLEKDKFSFMGALKVEKACLQCHVEQGYKVGDVIGGIRISIPTDMHNENIEVVTSKARIHTTVTIITSLLFVSIIIYTINSIYRRERKINGLNKTLEEKVEQRTKELQKANEKLLKISTIDDLTQIPNRRYFFDIANKTFSLAKRNGSIFSIVCIDIDFFKDVNDTYGHQEGDKVLKTVVDTINTYIRQSDTFSRVGGEEFIVLLNDAKQENSLYFAEKIRQAVEHTKYKVDDKELNITISLGITQYNPDDTSFEILLSRADQALYEAKNSGRNKCVTYEFI